MAIRDRSVSQVPRSTFIQDFGALSLENSSPKLPVSKKIFFPPIDLKTPRSARSQSEIQEQERERVRELEYLGVVIEKRVITLSACISRLGLFASLALKRSLFDLKNLSLSISGEDKENVAETNSSTVRRRMVEIYNRSKLEIQQNATAFTDALQLTIPIPLVKQIFKETSTTVELNVMRVIIGLIPQLVTTGNTCKRLLTNGRGIECMLKCRYRNGQVQVLTKELIGNGGMKTVEKVIILSGYVGSLGKIFAYAKPRKDNPNLSYDVCLTALCNELSCARFLRQKLVRNIMGLESVYREKRASRTVKGIAMEWYDLGDAFSLPFPSLPLPRDELINRLHLAGQIAVALAEIHRNNVIHGDFKPHNLFLKHTLRGISAFLGDFGCAVEKGKTYTGYVGTPPYIAPEQWLGFHTGWKATSGIDMWSFGLWFLQLLGIETEDSIGRNIPANFMALPVSARYDLISQRRQEMVLKLDVKNPINQLIADLLSEDPALRPSGEEVALHIQNVVLHLK